jgi:hypothetical protein
MKIFWQISSHADKGNKVKVSDTTMALWKARDGNPEHF